MEQCTLDRACSLVVCPLFCANNDVICNATCHSFTETVTCDTPCDTPPTVTVTVWNDVPSINVRFATKKTRKKNKQTKNVQISNAMNLIYILVLRFLQSDNLNLRSVVLPSNAHSHVTLLQQLSSSSTLTHDSSHLVSATFTGLYPWLEYGVEVVVLGRVGCCVYREEAWWGQQVQYTPTGESISNFHHIRFINSTLFLSRTLLVRVYELY